MSRFRVIRFDEVDSTNAVCRQLALEGAPEGAVVHAMRQTSGRGRQGRTWHSTGDFGLWFSILLRPGQLNPGIDAPMGGMVSIAAGVGVCGALERFGIAVGLKWPNDVLISGRKVCGILAESALDDSRLDWVVLGIGINVNTPDGGFPPELRSIATAVDQHLPKQDVPEKGELLAAVLDCVFDEYRMLAQGKAESVRESAEVRMGSMLGARITCSTSSGPVTGVAEGLRPTGALILRAYDGREFTVTAGDVTIGSGKVFG